MTPGGTCCRAAVDMPQLPWSWDCGSSDRMGRRCVFFVSRNQAFHPGQLASHVHGLESHIVQTGGTLLCGCRSNHLPPDSGPIGWCTGQASHVVSRLKTTSKTLLAANVLAELGGTPGGAPDPSVWARLLDSDLPPAAATDAMYPSGCATQRLLRRRRRCDHSQGDDRIAHDRSLSLRSPRPTLSGATCPRAAELAAWRRGALVRGEQCSNQPLKKMSPIWAIFWGTFFAWRREGFLSHPSARGAGGKVF